MNRLPPEPDTCVFTLEKGPEKYIVYYKDTNEQRAECLRQLGRWASNKEISFTWYDAVVLSGKVRQGMKQ